jgi:nicotinamide mononucleotide transporter
MKDSLQLSWEYLKNIDQLEAAGLIFGLITVVLLIKEKIWNWPAGITYILISFVIFWQQQLYGDLLLHIFFLILNIYGWYHWAHGTKNKLKVPVTWLSNKQNLIYFLLSILGTFILGFFLSNVHIIWPNLKPASLAYWDATTTAFSITAMWLTARKNIENWIYWLFVDVLASAIYFYKGIHFYSLLYFIYIGLAVAGYLEWKKILRLQKI